MRWRVLLLTALAAGGGVTAALWNRPEPEPPAPAAAAPTSERPATTGSTADDPSRPQGLPDRTTPPEDAAFTPAQRAYHRALSALQQASAEGQSGANLTARLEALWRTALDSGEIDAARSVVADWQTHPDARVRELVATALTSLAAAGQPAASDAADSTLGHETLRDLALDSPEPAQRRDAIEQLALLDHPLRDEWLEMVLEREPEPALRAVARAALKSPPD